MCVSVCVCVCVCRERDRDRETDRERERERERESTVLCGPLLWELRTVECVRLHAFHFLITSLFLGRQPKINYVRLFFFFFFLLIFVLVLLLSPCVHVLSEPMGSPLTRASLTAHRSEGDAY